MNASWYTLKDPDKCMSPALLVYPDRISKNIDLMIRIAGGTGRLRPHIKTHKTSEIIRMQMDRGIDKFKCATIAEAELLGQCGARDVLLAMQPVGINQDRFLELINAFPDTTFSTLVDDPGVAKELNQKAKVQGVKTGVFIDLNVGMNRTGIAPGEQAVALYAQLNNLSFIQTRGLHVYDGHIRQPDLQERTAACNEAFAAVGKLRSRLEAKGLSVETVIAGGSPSFPIHAARPGVELSPGTTLLWDAHYMKIFPDMEFLPAAVLFTRVVSRPAEGLLCLDLGHKSIAPEMPFPRAFFPEMKSCRQVSQSEEHLVLECKDNSGYPVGTPCYAIPMHICPTVAKYPRVFTVTDGEITGSWSVAARDHKLHI